MIDSSWFVGELQKEGTTFFCGVPDSLLKDLCAFIAENVDLQHHLITANEGNAIGVATGHYLATSSIPFVYLQNSGLGNTVNPLLSLADESMFQIPMLLCIGWRGEPGVPDEVQHGKQGELTLPLLQTLGIPYEILSNKEEEVQTQLVKAYTSMRKHNAPFALVVRKGLFAPYKMAQDPSPEEASLSREKALEIIVGSTPNEAIFVATTGMASRELYELRERLATSHQQDFLSVGSMGHASQIALGLALHEKERPIFCLDGDGSVLMHLGSMAIIGNQDVPNFIHIILNNGSHDSVGGQPTVARKLDFPSLALSVGYQSAQQVANEEELRKALALNTRGPHCIEVLIKKGARHNLGRPKISPIENKQQFIDYIRGDI